MKVKTRISHTQMEKFFKMLSAKDISGANLSSLLKNYNLPAKISDLSPDDFQLVRDSYERPIEVGSILHTTDEYCRTVIPSSLRVGTALEVYDNPNKTGKLIRIQDSNNGQIHYVAESWFKEGSPLEKKCGYSYSYSNKSRIR